MPNGMRRKRNLPNGVLKVVSSGDSRSSSICQKQLLASMVENTVALGMRDATSSTVLIQCRLMGSFKGFIEIPQTDADVNTAIFLFRFYHL